MCNFIFTDRYLTTGTFYPDSETMCHECDGMGCYPVSYYPPGNKIKRKGAYILEEPSAINKKLWLEIDSRDRCFIGFLRRLKNAPLKHWTYYFGELFKQGWGNWGCDSWHFITCPVCNGTRVQIKSTETIND